jgi:hypothetical protein
MLAILLTWLKKKWVDHISHGVSQVPAKPTNYMKEIYFRAAVINLLISVDTH